MKKLLGSIILLSALAMACPPQTVQGAPDQTIQKEGWVLKIWITAKGTRSQGHIAHLYHNGVEVCPVNGKNDIVTPLGKLHYNEGKMPWDWHGWKPAAKRFLIIG